MLLASLAASGSARVDQEPAPEPSEPTVEEHVTVIATTRSGRRIEDEPLRVETLEREEIEEKMLMAPGDIVILLNKRGGMRVQSTSPSLEPPAFESRACADVTLACWRTDYRCSARSAVWGYFQGG